MDIKEIISLALHIGAVVGYVIILLVSIIKKVRNKNSASTESTDVLDTVLNIASAVVNDMTSVEDLYNKVFRDGVKAGAFKLRDVLASAEKLCNNAGVTYNAEAWTSFVNRTVDFKNVQSTGQNENENKKSEVVTYES